MGHFGHVPHEDALVVVYPAQPLLEWDEGVGHPVVESLEIIILVSALDSAQMDFHVPSTS
jgi:hypothetical protein